MKRDTPNGNSFCVSNCEVWAAIYYLDSATDYRECLSGKGYQETASDSLVLLDDEKHQARSHIPIALVLVWCFIFLMAGFFLYMVEYIF